MLKLACLTLPFVLTLCSIQPAQAAPAKMMVTANGSKPGTFEVKEADGTLGRSVLNADGTYQDLDSKGKVTAEGKWTVTNANTCFAPTTKGKSSMCFKETAPGKDGSFTATPDKGKPVTVTPMKAH